MELHLQSHHFTHRLPDWRAAALAGLVAGTVFIVMELLVVRFLMYQGAWGTVTMVAAIILGRDALMSPAPPAWLVIGAALVVHYALSIVLATLLAALVAAFRLDTSYALTLGTGLAFGALVYVINFYGLVRFFPWFNEARSVESLFAHMVFGLMAAGSYKHLERGQPEGP